MELSGLAAHSSTRGRRPRGPAVLAAALVLATIAAAAVQARTIADNTPAATREAEDLGPANASETISVTLWLQAPGSEAAAEQLVRELYDQSSPRFHRWLSEPDAVVDEPAGSVVAAVSGLSEHHMHPQHVRPIDPDTGAPLAATPLAAVPAGAFFSAQCFRGSQQHTFTTDGDLPTASYAGNRYG